jgi:thiol-disulfide isomerase/thioredoxin
MGVRAKKALLYSVFVLIIIWGQFLTNNGLLTGKPPIINQTMINGRQAIEQINKGPAIIYFWAEWCGICKMMQSPITEVLKDYPGITVAVKSGADEQLKKYMQQKQIQWNVINDQYGEISELYKIKGVPFVIITDKTGEIIYTVSGYSFEIGLRFRLWLAELFSK